MRPPATTPSDPYGPGAAMRALRPIAPVALTGLEPKVPATTLPELTLIAPGDVLVDDRFQRNLSERSVDLIRRIIAEFDWRRWRPPVCCWTDDGLTAIDGQHDLVAAMSHPFVDKVPVMIVEAESLQDRASMLIGINADRLAVTKQQMHVAAVVAGDVAATKTQALCDRLGIRVLKACPNSRKKYGVRDTVAVAGISALIQRHGEQQAEAIIRVLAEADLAPIKESQIKAAEQVLIDPEFAGQVEPVDLTVAIAALRGTDDKDAKVFAATHGVSLWRALAATWFKKARKAKPGPRITQFDPAEGRFEPTVKAVLEPRSPSAHTRVTDRRVASVIPLGEPEPGRSALDPRRRAHA